MLPNEPAVRAETKECRFCNVTIREYNYGMGWEWLHIFTNPDLAPGQPYKICKTYTVATPPETIGEWTEKLFDPKHAKEEDERTD